MAFGLRSSIDKSAPAFGRRLLAVLCSCLVGSEPRNNSVSAVSNDKGL